jgi:hypothetical protein
MANTHFYRYTSDLLGFTTTKTSLRIKNSKPAPIPLRNIRISREKFTHHNERHGFSNAEQRRIKLKKVLRPSAVPAWFCVPISSNAFPPAQPEPPLFKEEKRYMWKKM